MGFLSRKTIQPHHNRKETLMQQTLLLLSECGGDVSEPLKPQENACWGLHFSSPLPLSLSFFLFSFSLCLLSNPQLYLEQPIVRLYFFPALWEVEQFTMCPSWVQIIFDLTARCKNTEGKQHAAQIKNESTDQFSEPLVSQHPTDRNNTLHLLSVSQTK